MSWDSLLHPLLGGALIGVAVTLMLLFNGRVTGVSGILASALGKPRADGWWRWFFLFGMIGGGALMFAARPELFANQSGRGAGAVLLAGLLVGYGTAMAGGCTSGHGICGISRLSFRSMIATLIFMAAGFLTVQAARHLLEGAA